MLSPTLVTTRGKGMGLWLLSMALLTTLIMTEQATGASAEQRVVGVIQSKQVLCPVGSGGVICSAGTVSGDLQGPFEFTADTVVRSETQPLSFVSAEVVIHTLDGDLHGVGEGVLDRDTVAIV